MAEIPFHQTGYGRRFFEAQLPELITALDQIAAALNAALALGNLEAPATEGEMLTAWLHRAAGENTRLLARCRELARALEREHAHQLPHPFHAPCLSCDLLGRPDIAALAEEKP